jgi:hypothetical protein
MNYEELLKKLGFARCGDTRIYQISIGGALGIHLDAIDAMTTLELKDHIISQLETLRKNLIMHIDGTVNHTNKLTTQNLDKYEGLN